MVSLHKIAYSSYPLVDILEVNGTVLSGMPGLAQ